MIGTTVFLLSVSKKDLPRGPIRPIPRIISQREIMALVLEWQAGLFWDGLFCASLQVTQKQSSPSPPQLRGSISRQKAVWRLVGQVYFFWEDDPCPAQLLALLQIQNFLLVSQLHFSFSCWHRLFREIGVFFQSYRPILWHVQFFLWFTRSPVKGGAVLLSLFAQLTMILLIEFKLILYIFFV